jgi:hypothetical protein
VVNLLTQKNTTTKPITKTYNLWKNLTIEIKITDPAGRSIKANVDYNGYIETKKLHGISLVEDVMNHLVEEIKVLKR